MLVGSMREQANIHTVRAIYAAFGRGDLAALLERMDDEIVWITPGSGMVPLAGRRQGIAEVRAFFEELAQRLTFTAFEAREYIAQGNRVVVLVHYAGRYNDTGRGFMAESAMLWTIGNGQAIRFQEYTDTEALARAARPADEQAQGAGIIAK
jgi:ketosteroid isomerase-like protein